MVWRVYDPPNSFKEARSADNSLYDNNLSGDRIVFLDCKKTFLDYKKPFLDYKKPFLDYKKTFLGYKKTFLDYKKPFLDYKKTGFPAALWRFAPL
ncbi:MAG: hypothetical protein LBD13_05655 [Spirochaetaceae bacterium]|nr:hypothetical protein [Spirochaetaceae bacterium]